jgi:hypothetical protein
MRERHILKEKFLSPPVPYVNFSDLRTRRVAYRSGVHTHAVCDSPTVAAGCKIMEFSFLNTKIKTFLLVSSFVTHKADLVAQTQRIPFLF